MFEVVLPTKLYMPRMKSRQVSRPRLLRKLDPVRERKLALVSAPAGFGKTTFLGEWLQRQGELEPPLPGTWLSLDADDNDPARFTAYLITALQKVEPDLGSEVQAMLKADQTIPIDGIWEYLVSDIASVLSPFVLVLDDYQVIENPIIHQCLAFLLEQMPHPMHLIISSRADPPLPLSRLRVRGELVELRASDLRFNSEEMAEFLMLWTGKKLSAADYAELEARTEGWIAGLQLAALAMQSLLESEPEGGWESALSSFIHRMNGNNRFILDYLAEEVLCSQPETIRSFLLKTCILERLTAPLCDTVADSQDSQSILISLEKQNLFLFPLDDERNWYRYHPLFADLLRSSLQHQEPSLAADLHRKASAWYEGQGWITEAIQHALKVPEPGEAMRLMEKAAPEMVRSGEVTTIQNWSTWLDEGQVRQLPTLCLCFAWAFLVSDKVERSEQYLSLVNQIQGNPSPAAPELQDTIMAAYSMIAYYKGDYENAIQYARQAVKRLSPQQAILKGMLALSSGAASEMIGEDEAAFQWYQEAKSISHAFGNRTAELSVLKKQGDLQMRHGQLQQAAHSYQQALQLGKFRDSQLLPVAALTVAAMGQILYEWDQLEEAERYLIQGIELSRKLENTFALLSSLQSLARLRWIQRDRESALRLRDETEQVVMEFPPIPACAAHVAVQQIRMYLQIGETQAALRWAQLYAQDWRSDHAYAYELMTILWARVWIAQGNASEAIEAMKHTLPLAREAGRWGVVIELLVLQALALAMARQVPPALAALEEALRLGETEGYTRIFLDEGKPMARLLRMAYRLKEKGSRDYQTRLLVRLLSAESPAPPVSPEGPTGKSISHPVLIDPLSERELEVLGMMADGSSNQEIADRLVITVGTVKAHVSSIFSKLDARSRTQAISKANQLRLI